MHFVDQHRRDFKRLGVFGRWEDPYLTMSHEYEACIADAFLTFLEKGYVYRGLKPVYWCIHDSTALAEAEVEYEDHTSPSIWVKFPVVGGAAASKLGANVDAVIWTTTPWTLPHNRALAFHPDFEYVVAETAQGALLVAADRVASLCKDIGIKRRAFAARGKAANSKVLSCASIPERLARACGACGLRDAGSRELELFTPRRDTAWKTFKPASDTGWKLTRRWTIRVDTRKACRNTKAKLFLKRIHHHCVTSRARRCCSAKRN